jgi:hypothetical protein
VVTVVVEITVKTELLTQAAVAVAAKAYRYQVKTAELVVLV